MGPRWWVAALWLAAALIAQATILHYIVIRGAEPNVVLVAVVWYAIRVNARHAAVYGLIAGIMLDMISGHSGGAWTISTTIVAIVAGALSRGFFADSIPLVGAITAVATLFDMLIFWIVRGFEGYPSGLAGMQAHQALIQAVLNAIVISIGTLIVRRFDTRFA